MQSQLHRSINSNISLHCSITVLILFFVSGKSLSIRSTNIVRNIEVKTLLKIIYKTERVIPILNVLDIECYNYSYPLVLQTLRALETKKDNQRLVELLPLFLSSHVQTQSISTRQFYATFLLISAIKSSTTSTNKRSLQLTDNLIENCETKISLTTDSISLLKTIRKLCYNETPYSLFFNSNNNNNTNSYRNEQLFLLGSARSCPWSNVLKFYTQLIQQQNSNDALPLYTSRIHALGLITSVLNDRYIELRATCCCTDDTINISPSCTNTNTNSLVPSFYINEVLLNKTFWLLDILSNTSNSSNNSNSNSSSSSINTSYAEYDSPLTSINNINSIIFNTDLDHDDFPLVQFYLSGKSSYAINQLKYNSWFYLKQHQNEIMSSFLSLNSLTFNKSINEFYNNNILLDLITQHKYINNKNLINNYNQNNPITTTTTNNNNNNNFQKNQKISTDRSESQLVFSYLIFGDGDLSFSKALVKLLQQYQQFYNNNCSKSSNNNISISVCNKYQVLSTIYDTKDKVTKKYNNAKENIQFIEKSGLGEMQYSVDVMLYRNYSIQNKYNVAIFNFPFADTVDHKKNTTEKKKSRQSADSEFDTMYVYKGRHMKLVEGF